MKRYIAAVFLGLCTLAIAQEEKNIRPNSAALQLTKEQHQAIQAAIQKLKTEKEREAAKVLTPIEQIAQFICLPAAKEKIKKQMPDTTRISISSNSQKKLAWNEISQTLAGVIGTQNNHEKHYYLFTCKLNSDATVKNFSYNRSSNQPIPRKEGHFRLPMVPIPPDPKEGNSNVQ